MLIDVIALILLVMGIFKGLRNGLILGVFSFLAFIIGLAAALKLSVVVADYLGNSVSVSERWLPVIAFVLVFIGVVLLVRLGARLIERLVQFAMLGWLNRLGGVVFFVLINLFIFSIVLFYAEQLRLIGPETARASVVYPYLQPLAPNIIGTLGAVLPFFKSMFTQLLEFFQGVADAPAAPKAVDL